MAVTLQQFVENLIQSGLFSAAELAAFQESLPPENRPTDAQELARSLNRAGKLTKYQAAAVYQGKTRGLVFDEYVVLDAIGAGGMGEVFKAQHRTMERIVALKVLPRRAMKSPGAVERFHREVRAAAKLTHPNIVTAYDAREHEGIHCLVMEYVDGKDLANVLADEGPLPVDRAVDYVSQAAKGLEYAHQQGVIHRDIKPGNLLLDRDGTVKILDMGLARVGTTDAPTDPKGAEPLTASGQLMGTWDYMAPEQAADTRGADHRADIYSLGCTLYRLLAGKPPYSGETAIQTLLAHQQAPIPSLCEARPDVPQELDAVFRKMMAKELEDRYQSMGDVVADLEACLPGDELPAPLSGGRAAESSTDSKLTAFFRVLAQGGVATRRKATRVAEETVQRGPEQETNLVAGEETAPSAARPNRLMLISAAGVATGVVMILGLFLTLGRSGDEAEKKPVEATAKTDERQAKDERPPHELAARTPSPSPEETEPESKPREWQAAWDDADVKAKALIEEGRFAEAEQLYIALGEGHEDSQLDAQINDAATAIRAQAQTAYEQAEAQAKQLANKEAYAEAREALHVVINRHAIPANVAAAKKVLAEIEAAEQQARAQAAAAQAAAAKMAEVEKQKQVEQRYAAAMKPVEDLVAAWDFRGASAALAKVRFEEEALAARLAAWREGVERLADLKARIIAEINDADPPLKTTALLIRGAGRDVVGAEEGGLTTKKRNGETELLPWPDAGPQALGKLVELASAPGNAGDRFAAGLLSLAARDPMAAERCFEEAQSLGAEIGPYLAPLAAAMLGQAEQLVETQEFGEAEALLANLEAKYADTAWLTLNKPTLDAVRMQVRAGEAAVLEAEGDKLYAEAARLFKERQFFDLRPVVEKLKADYSKTRLLTDGQRDPSFAQMEEAVTNLGEFLTVRLDGKGDFTSIQAAVSAAPVNSLVEIQDSGLYNERVEIPQHRAGLTIRGAKGCWPVIASLGPVKDFPILLAVRAPGISLERLVLAHVTPRGSGAHTNQHALSVFVGPFRLRSTILFIEVRDSLALWTDAGTESYLQDCLVLNYIGSSGHVVLANSILLGDQVSPHAPFEVRSCTLLSQCGNSPSVLTDSIIANVGARAEHARIENCNVLGGIPSALGKGCFSAEPQFRDPANLDYRLMPTSPCIGKASDGGDIGCRYTPEMLELCQKALELRVRGIIKF